jgi:hypothetical protein
MASQKTKTSNSNRRSSRSPGSRQTTRGEEEYQFTRNLSGDETIAEREYQAYTSDLDKPPDPPDVLLDAPVVKVDSIHLELDNLDAHVALRAHALNHYLKLHVGVDVHLGKVRVDIKGVEAQALVRVRLDHVTAIVDRVLTTLDRNPKILESIGEAVEDIGAGAGRTLEETGHAVQHVGKGAEGAVQDVGSGAGQAVGDIGQGAGQAVGDIGEGAGEGVGQLGEGAGQAVGEVGQGAGQAVGNLDQTLGGLGQTAGQAAGGVGELAGGAGDAAGGVGQAVGDGAGGGQPGGAKVAKEAAKVAAKELGSAAADEAKDLGVAATRKIKELGARRRERRAEKEHATEAALRAAEELDVDLDEIEGTGSEGRIVIGDVRKAAEA